MRGVEFPTRATFSLFACFLASAGLYAAGPEPSIRLFLGVGSFETSTPAPALGFQHLSSPSTEPSLFASGSLAALESLGPQEQSIQSRRLGMAVSAPIFARLQLNMGLEYNQIRLQCNGNCGELNVLYGFSLAAEEQASGGSASAALRGLLPALDILSESDGIETGILDVGLSYHLDGVGPLLPYLGLNLGFGTCLTSRCYLFRLMPHLGLRWQVSRTSYLSAELQYSVENYGNRSGTPPALKEPLRPLSVAIGAGFYL